MTITARSKPYRVQLSDARVCANCGIERRTNKTGDYYCLDCKPMAVALGWLAPPPTYTCTRCHKTFQGSNRDLCAKCAWNTGKGRNR